jgi:hypothetical protein
MTAQPKREKGRSESAGHPSTHSTHSPSPLPRPVLTFRAAPRWCGFRISATRCLARRTTAGAPLLQHACNMAHKRQHFRASSSRCADLQSVPHSSLVRPAAVVDARPLALDPTQPYAASETGGGEGWLSPGGLVAFLYSRLRTPQRAENLPARGPAGSAKNGRNPPWSGRSRGPVRPCRYGADTRKGPPNYRGVKPFSARLRPISGRVWPDGFCISRSCCADLN